ncbi:isopeptide-forming domain-containing fimbrial protein [Pseudoxanthomonas mexicana]|uniref:isopeptide-forming domain-containing fimbrial protein n=1 Tax=Pseudoxanthomonas mexicana TaxID=128785 RepID=UPI001FD64315|nr:isopeptide-forming domain-containing fimbrial protein [Pseudoxanthomonas mexicana]UOV03191.1 isopeptide-forming domain-containing fimbrial protein [Pseudoxanthomonas mexicana]
MLLGLAALCTSPPAGAQACGFAPIYTNTGSGVTDVPTNAEQLQSWSPTGTLLSTVPLANNYGDIALDPTGSVLYAIGFSFNEPYARRLYRIDPATGAELSFVSLTGDIVTDNVVVLNSLGFRGDGTLLVGGAFISAIYVIDPVTGSTSRFGASFPANVTAAGDFVTLPDGDLLASGRDNTGGAYYLYRMRADGSVFPIGEVPSTFGAAMSRGTVYLIGEAGQIHRVDALPSLATTAPLPITTIVDSGQSFYGATSAQDAGSRCDPAALTLRKTWVNAAVNDAVAIQATVDATVVDTLSSTADTTDETDTDATPITVYGGDVITFSETFAVGDPGQYGSSLTCTGNQAAVSGMTLTVANADTDIVCTYVNARPSVTYSKSASTSGPVAVGDTITYTLTTVVANSQTTSVTTLTDTLGAGLTFGAVTNAGAYTCNSSNPLVCTLPVGTVPGTYTVTYTATVNDQATGTVDNAVVGINATCTTNCGTSTPVTAPAVSYSKSASTPGPVAVGDTITYTLTTAVANSQTTSVTTLTDTLGTGLTFGAVTNAGAYTCNSSNPLVCTLPVGTVPGTYTVTYTATVNDQAVGTVNNAVVGTNATCTTDCGTSTPVTTPSVTYSKSAGTSGPVAVGDTITYTLTTTVVNAVTTSDVVLTDTLGTGLDFVAVDTADPEYTCNSSNPLACTLPVGTVPGTYTVTYTATVNDQAVGTVDNAVVGTGEDAPTCAGTCTTQTPVAAPRVVVSKSSDPGTGAQVQVGQTVRYTLTVEVSASALREALVLVDTPDRGLTLGALPAGCTFDGTRLTCQLPAGTPASVHTLTYEAVVNPNAGPVVGNQVSATGGGGELPTCTTCSTEHELEAPQIRLSKTAGSREVRIGDLVRYTLTVENVGRVNVVNGSVVDTPAAGFSYVEGSLLANDADAMATVSGGNPLRFSGVDVAAGETATLVYVMRVGAGVRPGIHVNQAQVRSATDDPVSNVATAEVVLTADPLLDDSLVFGTVFNDRDGDGWQDSAALSGVKVQGGFAPTAYIANSTTVDRGAGPQPEPDASSPLLHGIAVGAISGRQSVADPVQDHEVVIRQRLNELSFTDDFVLTSNQGVTVRMDAAGNTRVEQSGEAAKGLTAAAPTVERRVAQSEGGYVVDYVIRNTGIDERGIPGVRIASVEGLLIETDQYGRYHLAGVSGGAWERGRNFILKVDPSTLPAGAQFTTDNPLLRRVTPGVPVRFDWGVKLPEQVIEGGTEQVELEMGEVFFAPGSAEVREKYLPVIEAMAAKVRQYQGGEVVIQANGDSQGLAFERANAVKAALLDKLDAASAQGLVVSARGSVDDPSSMIVGVDEGGALLGTVLFDTDKSNIRPEFEPLLDKVAAALEKMGGGSIAIVGHTDVRASHAYNVALGMRRAKAVYEALAQRLSPQVRANVRVEASNDPTAPVGVRK